MDTPRSLRRRLLAASMALPTVAMVGGCRETLPVTTAAMSTDSALRLLGESASAHGADAFSRLNDVNVAYEGRWHRLVAKIQPDLVDAGFRGGSEERFLVKESLYAQSHLGPRGHKQVARRQTGKSDGNVRVWFNDEESKNPVQLDAAALVADGYSLFLLGPLWIAELARAGRQMILELVGTTVISTDRVDSTCDMLAITMQPGIGRSPGDRMVLYIDRATRLMRKVRFSLEGLESTRGAVVEVDTLGTVSLYGVQWPTIFHERLLRPAPLKVHDWRLVGLDVNRGYHTGDVEGQRFTGMAAGAAKRLA